MIPVTTLAQLFRERVKASPEHIAYRYFKNKNWHDLTWQDMSIHVANWQAALAKENLAAGDRVAIMLRNCPEWVMFDQAALGLGLVTVPLYMDDRPDNIAYIINDANVKLLLIADAKQWQSLSKLESVQRIITINLEDWLPNSTTESLRAEESAPDELASIVYTSGTTGKPKGVMLSHRNLVGNVLSISECTEFKSSDLFLSFLPLSHTFERTGGYYLPMVVNATVAYARSVPQLATDLVTQSPTVLISVPRIYEQVYSKIQNQLDKKSAVAKKLFNLTIDVGWRRFEYQQKRAGWHYKLLLWPLLNKLVAQAVLKKLGGKMRFAISGGAALSPEISRLFIGLGLKLLQGYGLTETSPVITVNRLEDNIPSSIGTTIPGAKVKLGENDELLTHSPYVMLGYWNNPTATAAAIDQDGWFHTGDKARIDEGGHLYITGRIKDIIVMGNGEKIPPTDMEMAILVDNLFDQVMLIGEGKPFLSCLIVLNPENWENFTKELNIDPKQAVLKRIAKHIKEFPGYAQIRRVSFSLEAWSVENGLLTPTLKMKRAVIMKRYETAIEKMYRGF
ncbi:AMP-dependent synthetase/ligase [Candidatus Marithrix sp. Canyon 246]|uniref:AMP-dependent synthetase/ligase n=1 Tax=Candidatus Marithrix sp. Canyon 246 TaxID=1827136 RepID=UPI000849FB7B|nr:long-chain fatty acid--CoA ligase [Candidatus Marithrix sp. Canyon 246]